MAEFVADCPRCHASHTTFDLQADVIVGAQYGWKHHYETFGVCRRCGRGTIFVVSDESPATNEIVRRKNGLCHVDGNVNGMARLEGHISLKDTVGVDPPEYLPSDILSAFSEGSTALAVGCPNAAATMFRLCVDLATRSLLPKEDEDGLNKKVRRDLGLRLPWLFSHGFLPTSLEDLSTCIREDGNDGAHAGLLTKEDAEDLLDFTKALLERLFTEPKRLQIAAERRDARRTAKPGNAGGA